MYTCKELKVLSKEQLKGNWGKIVLVQIILAMIISVVIIFEGVFVIFWDGIYEIMNLRKFYVGIVVLILLAIASFGIVKIVLNISRGKNFKISDIFYDFKNFVKVLKIYFRIYIFIFIIKIIVWSVGGIFIATIATILALSLAGSDSVSDSVDAIFYVSMVAIIILCLIIVWIKKYMEYYFSIFVILDDKNISSIEAMKISKKLSNGNKLKMVLYSLYVSMPLLVVVAVGLLFLNFNYSIEMSSHYSWINNFWFDIEESIFIIIFVFTVFYSPMHLIIGVAFFVLFKYYNKTGYSAFVLFSILTAIFYVISLYVGPMIRLGLANIYAQAKKEKQNENS